MPKLTNLAAAAMLTLFPAAAIAQTQPAQAPAATPETAQQPAAPTIQQIVVVDIEELSAAEQTRVNEATAQAGEAQLASLRQSIDANPQVAAALQDEGLTSASVIAVAMAQDGTLTLVTKKS